jgi:radical SAM superfamily enzyme YgiQ (UPF0313 family)
MRILLLNPPGQQNYLRDYYCTTVSKSDYYYHPVDLLYLSGTLAREHEVHVLEALARRLTVSQAIREIKKIDPEILVALVSAVSWDEDQVFLTELNACLPHLRIMGTGDIFRELRHRVWEGLAFLDAGLVDFSTEDILRYLRRPSGNPVDNVIYRHQGELIVGAEKHGSGRFNLPLPRIDLFDRRLYSFPFVRQEPFMTVLSDFGCPYGCTFCPVSTLGFKIRPVPEVMEELKQLWNAGYREVHFRDQTFGVNRERTLELCHAIRETLPQLTWSCFSRVDVLDEARIQAMSRSGCHSVIVGIEFDDDEMQVKLDKNIRKDQMFRAVELCHRHQMKVVGTFMLGLPDHDENAVLRTGELSKALDLDFASFNLAIPRLGTPWRRELIRDGLIDDRELHMNTVEGTSTFKRSKLTQEQLSRLRAQIERDFYLRPSYLLKRLLSLRTLSEYRTLWRNGSSVLLGVR